jgi:hypothetical protein
MKISYYINKLYIIATIKIRLMMLSYQLINHRIQIRFPNCRTKVDILYSDLVGFFIELSRGIVVCWLEQAYEMD